MARHVGDNVRRLRLARKLTLEQVAEMAGYAPSTLCEIEKGKISPSVLMLPRLTRALGEDDVGVLFEGVG